MKHSALSLLILFILCAPISCNDKGVKKQEVDKPASSVSDTTLASSVEENTTAIPDNTAGTRFVEGTLVGKVYTSDYAGFRFNGADTLSYKTKDDIYTEQHMKNRFKAEDEKYIIESEILDASAIDTETYSAVNFTFIDTKKRFPGKTDVTFDDFIEKRSFDGTEWVEYNITEPETVTLGGSEYTKVRVSVDYSPENATLVYIRKIDDDYTLKITYSTTAQDDGSDFESRFETLD